MRLPYLIVVTLLLSCIAVQGAAVPPHPGPTSLTQTATRRSVLRFETTGTAEFAFAPHTKQPDGFRLRCTCVRDGDRLDVLTVREDNGKPVCAWRSIVDGWYLAYEVPPAGKQAVSGLFAHDGSRFVGAALPSGLTAFDGYVTADLVSLDQIIRTATSLKTSTAKIDGTDCLLLVVDAPDYGHYQIWLDSAHQGYPIKIVVIKDAKSYWGQRRLNEWANLAPLGSHGTVTLQSLTFTLDHARFNQIERRWFPLSCRLTRVEQFTDGNQQKVVMECHRTGLDLNPDLQAMRAFTPELREGARLENQADPQLPYQWKAGTPQPLVDTAVVKQMDRTAAAMHQELAAGGNP